MTKRKIKKAEDLTIVDIGHKGMCIAKDLDGKVYLVRGGVPGDLVDVGIRRKKKGLPFGDVIELKKPSEFRTNPICQHFGSCGGCKWQDLMYSKQIELKEKQVYDAITRIAHIEGAEMQPILSSAKEYGYRNKMEYTFTNRRYLSDKEVQSKEDFPDRRGLGFHRTGAFDQVVDIHKCHLQDEIGDRIRNRANELARDLSIAYYDNREHFGILRNLIIRTNTSGEAMVTVVIAENMPTVAERLLSPMVDEFEMVKSWNYVVNSKVNDSLGDCNSINLYGEKHLTENIGGKKYIISPLSFFQTNSWQAEKLYDLVKEYAQEVSEHFSTCYDLYCGTGSIGIYLSDMVDHLIGIEINPDAIRDARINAELNDISNAKFFVGDVIDVVSEDFVATHDPADLIITDPPRAGMHGDLLDFLKVQTNKHLIYVSCNPSTLARDIAVLSDTFTLVKYRAVDMFPHTSHIETVALLERK